MDILGLGMADGCELRVHPTGKAVVRLSVQSQGQGHETTFAQIVAEELGIPPDDIDVVHGDTDQTPFGLGTYGSRSTPVSGAAAALVARKVRDKAKIIASGMLEASVADLEWDKGSFRVKGDPSAAVSIADIAMRAHGAGDLPEGIEGGLTPRSVTTRRISPIRTARTSASSTSTPAPRWSRCAASWPSTTAAPGSTR